MNVALSRNGAWVLRSFFALVVVFLYAPIVILVIFSFNDSQLPSFPLSGFTLHWYHQFLVNADLRSALRDERDRRRDLERRRRPARRARLDRARAPALPAASRRSPRCCSARS